jgi:hypothetical protein
MGDAGMSHRHIYVAETYGQSQCGRLGPAADCVALEARVGRGAEHRTRLPGDWAGDSRGVGPSVSRETHPAIHSLSTSIHA